VVGGRRSGDGERKTGKMDEVRAEITPDQYGWAGLHLLLYFSRSIIVYALLLSIAVYILFYILHISMALPEPSYSAAVHSSSPPAPTFTNSYYCYDYSSSSSLSFSLSPPFS
jgi:hypothetical protein